MIVNPIVVGGSAGSEWMPLELTEAPQTRAGGTVYTYHFSIPFQEKPHVIVLAGAMNPSTVLDLDSYAAITDGSSSGAFACDILSGENGNFKVTSVQWNEDSATGTINISKEAYWGGYFYKPVY